MNILLFRDAQIKIADYQTVQIRIPNEGKSEVFLNINTPAQVGDYFAEALNCQAHNLHRSCILFCTFALESALRYRYAEIVDEQKAYQITLNDLINWGIKENLIPEDEFNKVNVDFIRKYRNDIAHSNVKDADAQLRISRNYAEKMSSIVVHLVEYFINSLFDET